MNLEQFERFCRLRMERLSKKYTRADGTNAAYNRDNVWDLYEELADYVNILNLYEQRLTDQYTVDSPTLPFELIERVRSFVLDLVAVTGYLDMYTPDSMKREIVHRVVKRAETLVAEPPH